MSSKNKRAAVFTIVRDDPVWLRLWLRHYVQWFDPRDIYVLNHQSHSDDITLNSLAGQAHVLPVFNDAYYPLQWLMETVSWFQRYLLQSYDTVLYTDVDELLVTRPGGAYHDLGDYIRRMRSAYTVCTGYEVVHKHDLEPALDFGRWPLLSQRQWWYPTIAYSKPLLAQQPLTWSRGFHNARETEGVYADPELLLLHLHKIDFGYKKSRIQAREKYAFTKDPADVHCTLQYRQTSESELLSWWYRHIDCFLSFDQPQILEAIPEAVRALI